MNGYPKQKLNSKNWVIEDIPKTIKGKISAIGKRFKMLWQSKKCSWQHLAIEWGIRWSDKWQIFPVGNVSDNNHRALIFGFWKLYFSISYARNKTFNQDRKLFLQ